ncbi:MAG: tetratricopeptide repeat protein [Ruminococcaceae bacterium]|nr:tetratricopeptide repeat protein [Oscillospiraceae bacterium]
MAMGKPNKWKTDNFLRATKEPLKFSEDGKFRILHLTDIHEVMPEMDDDNNREIPENKDKETLNVIEKCLEEAKPDLVVFGGDNISGYWEEFNYDLIHKTITKIVEPIKRRNIPLALVFGNHDGEVGFYTDIQMIMYSDYDNCRSTLNDEDVFGCGNCNLTIKSSDGTKNAYSIWLMDSNDYMNDEDGDSGYAYVHKDQIAWYEKRSKELADENGGNPVPAILFQHIPVQQEIHELQEVTEIGENVVEKDGKFYSYGEKLISGRLREFPCPPFMKQDHTAQFKSWKKMGDIKAAFFGHDHVNDFHIKVDGISLYQTLGCGYFTYGKERGGRLIVLDENNPEIIETKTLEVERITTTDFSKKHDDDVAVILNEYDELLNKNQVKEAGEYLEAEILKAKERADAFTEMTLHNEVVSFHRRTGEQKKAVGAINEILELLEKFGLENSVLGANMYLNCATTLNFFRRTAEALPLFVRAFEAYINTIPQNDYRFAGFYNNYALALYESENYDEALRYFRKALNILSLYKGNDSEMAVIFCNLSHLFEKTNDEEMINNCLNSAYFALMDYDGEINNNFLLHCQKCSEAFRYFKKDEFSKEIEAKLAEIKK